VADQTSIDVASAALVAGGILLIIVVRVGWRILHGRARWFTTAVAVIAFICAVAYFAGAGTRTR
jgi:hypothetical protein